MTSGAHVSDVPHFDVAIDALTQIRVEQLRIFRIDPCTRRLSAVASSQLSKQLEALQDTPDELWIDIQAADPSKFEAFLGGLERHGATH